MSAMNNFVFQVLIDCPSSDVNDDGFKVYEKEGGQRV
jgi:hypothetical protein